MTKVLMISTDAKILTEGTPVFVRLQEYGKKFFELHIVVFTIKTSDLKSKVKIADNTFVYPTQSTSKLLYVMDAIKIGNSIIRDSGLSPNNSVITTQDPFETGVVGKSLSKSSGIPLHIQIHTDFYSPYFKKSILNKVRIALSKTTLPYAKSVRVVSDRIKNSLPENIQQKTRVLPIFVDVDVIKNMSVIIDLKKKYPQFKKIVLIASRLTKEKDISTALEAFKKVLQKELNTGLIIVGSGPEEIALKQIVNQLKIEKSVVFEPWADYETLVSYMKTSDVFLSSSLYEGYGLSMLEAHTAGLILVTTNAGIAPLLTANECLVNPGNREDIKQALLKALQGGVANKAYKFPYSSKEAYFEAYKADLERTLL